MRTAQALWQRKADGIPVERFQEAFARLDPAVTLRSGWGPKDAANTVAVRLGWYIHGRPDGPRVRRALGLCTYPPGHGYPSRHREFVSREMAARLCDAMGVAPAEVGL